METLQEFANHTKGLSYILGGVFLVAFVPFWLFLVGRQHRK